MTTTTMMTWEMRMMRKNNSYIHIFIYSYIHIFHCVGGTNGHLMTGRAGRGAGSSHEGRTWGSAVVSLMPNSVARYCGCP